MYGRSGVPDTETVIRPRDIFNSAVAVSAIGAAWELGALDELRERERLDIEDFAARHDLHYETILAMFTALASVRIVQRSDGTVRAGSNFAEVYHAKALFHWLGRGCSKLFAMMPVIARQANRTGDYYERDAAAISFACRDINAAFFDPVFWKALAGLEFAAVADLGCGSAERLIQIVGAHPGIRGLGIDIADGALGVASAAVAEAALGDRISLAKADVRGIAPRPEFAGIDLVTCFLMGHDFWPRRNCVATLRRIRAAFPDVNRFLLGDTTRTESARDDQIPLFTLGFETAHAMMGVYLPGIAEWEQVFAEGGWRCVAQHAIDMPAASVIFELAPL
jgi:SAM-dependent methyltransferase